MIRWTRANCWQWCTLFCALMMVLQLDTSGATAGSAHLVSDKPCWCPSGRTKHDILEIAEKFPDGKLRFKEMDRLLEVLRSQGSRKVAIISIIGPVRSGKSTLLNILHRYLTCTSEKESRVSRAGSVDDVTDRGSWLYEHSYKNQIAGADCNAKPFRTGSGISPITKGIWITAQPYYITDSNTAVFLMDTQGLYEKTSDSGLDSELFYISALFSSTLIFNAKNPDSRAIDYVGAYLRQLERGLSKKPCFQFLLCLARDFELNHTMTGEHYLEYLFQQNKGEVLDKIRKNFDDIEAFLMPPIRLGDDVSFSPGGLHPRFENGVEEFLRKYFSSEKLLPKTCTDREPMTGLQLADLFREYRIAFEHGNISTVRTLFEITGMQNARLDASDAFEDYRTGMTAKLKTYTTKTPDCREVDGFHEQTQRHVQERHEAKMRHDAVAVLLFRKFFHKDTQLYLEGQIKDCQLKRSKLLQKETEKDLADLREKWAESGLTTQVVTGIQTTFGVIAVLFGMYLLYAVAACLCRNHRSRNKISAV